jgi:hypothetical protein
MARISSIVKVQVAHFPSYIADRPQKTYQTWQHLLIAITQNNLSPVQKFFTTSPARLLIALINCSPKPEFEGEIVSMTGATVERFGGPL